MAQSCVCQLDYAMDHQSRVPHLYSMKYTIKKKSHREDHIALKDLRVLGLIGCMKKVFFCWWDLGVNGQPNA